MAKRKDRSRRREAVVLEAPAPPPSEGLLCQANGCPEPGLHEIEVAPVGKVRLCYHHRQLARLDEMRAETLRALAAWENPDTRKIELP